MSSHLDHLLQQTLEEIADAQPVPQLARPAVRRARRTRAIARTSVGVGAVLAIALVAAPFAVRAGGLGNAPPEAGAPGTDKYVVAAYGGVGESGGYDPTANSSLLLDPATGEYDKLPYGNVIPSPDGANLLIRERDIGERRTGIRDRRGGQVRWIPGIDRNYTHPEWSPDGSRILLSYRPRQGAAGFAIVDAETLAVTTVTTGGANRDVEKNNALGLGFVWTPDGQGAALTLSRPGRKEALPDTVTGIRFYDLTGKVTRHLAAKDGTMTAGTDFAPDGGRLALSGTPNGNGDTVLQIVDANTGAVQQRFSAPWGTLLGWYDEEHLMLARPAGQGGRWSAVHIVDLAGKTVRTAPLEGLASSSSVHIGSAEGLTGKAAKLAF